VGVAILLAEAGLESAILNIKINLKMIKDEKVLMELKSAIQELISQKQGKKEKILKIVEEKIE